MRILSPSSTLKIGTHKSLRNGCDNLKYHIYVECNRYNSNLTKYEKKILMSIFNVMYGGVEFTLS